MKDEELTVAANMNEGTVIQINDWRNMPMKLHIPPFTEWLYDLIDNMDPVGDFELGYFKALRDVEKKIKDVILP